MLSQDIFKVVFAYVAHVPPLKKERKKDLKVTSKLLEPDDGAYNYFVDIFNRSLSGQKHQIYFTMPQNSSNKVREQILSLINSSGPDEKKKYADALSKILAKISDKRNGTGLFVIIEGRSLTKERLMLLRFKKEEVVFSRQKKRGFEIELLDETFSKKNSNYKLALFEDVIRDNAFTTGYVIDKQKAITPSKELSKFWIKDFLLSEQPITPILGTKIFSKVIKKVMQQDLSLNDKENIIKAVISLKDSPKRHNNIEAICNQYFSRDLFDRIKKEVNNDQFFKQNFEMDLEILMNELGSKEILLNNGVIITVPTFDYENLLKVENLGDGKYEITTKGKIQNKIIDKVKADFNKRKSEKEKKSTPLAERDRKPEDSLKKITSENITRGEILEQEAEEPELTKEQASQKEKMKRSPENRGGRPRGSKITSIEKENDLKPPSSKADLICWNKGWEWLIGIELQENIEPVMVTQQDNALERKDLEEPIYILNSLQFPIDVLQQQNQDNQTTIQITKNETKPLVFKMRKNWKGNGRLVSRPSIGHYLVIVPDNWKRCEELSGPEPIRPGYMQIKGYKAHYFELSSKDNKQIAFLDSSGKEITIFSTKSRFMLKGNEIIDGSEDKGPLFGGEPPNLTARDRRIWEHISIVVIGEEGEGRKKWRTSFEPQVGKNEQNLPCELLNQERGWFFIRVYDDEEVLLESLDFRFIKSLENIVIEGAECFPNSEGYRDVCVRFLHQPYCKVEPANSEIQNSINIERKLTVTQFRIPPLPEYDKTEWLIAEDNTVITTTVLIERIWWEVGDISSFHGKWRDDTITVSRKEFTATTSKALWIKLPRKRWISKVFVGFNPEKKRPYAVGAENEEISIPFKDFTDSEEIQDNTQSCLFNLYLETPQGVKEACLLEIQTTIRCYECDYQTKNEFEAQKHLQEHLSDLFLHLSYDELYKRYRGSLEINLPPAIFQCKHCNYYVESDDPSATLLNLS